MKILYEIVAADVTDTRIYGRTLTEDAAKQDAERVAFKRGEVMRVVKIDTDRPEVLEAWTVRPE